VCVVVVCQIAEMDKVSKNIVLDNEIGHSIEVHLICSCIYNERSSFLAKLNGYRKRVSKVDINAQYNEKFIKTINNIIGY
jgi:hypothetical protein